MYGMIDYKCMKQQQQKQQPAGARLKSDSEHLENGLTSRINQLSLVFRFGRLAAPDPSENHFLQFD